MPGRTPTRLAFCDEYRSLVQSITDYAIFSLDPDGFVTSWSPDAEKMNGYSADEAVGLHVSRFFTQQDQARGWPARSLHTAREVGRSEEEGWRVRKDGSRFWATATIDAIWNENGSFEGFAKVIRDVSEQHAARQASHSSEKCCRLLMSNMVDYAIYTLDLYGYVTSWNAGAEYAKGFARDEILGQHFSVFYTVEDQANGKPATALKTAQAVGRFEEEGWRVRKDGTYFWASVVVDSIRDEANQLVGFAKVTRDISDKRKLEQSREHLHRAQKQQTVAQLASGVAHDVNHLLAAIMGSLALIATNPTDLRAVERLVRNAKQAADRGTKLTQQLLSFSGQQMLKPETTDLNSLIIAAEELLRRTAGKSIEVRISLDPALWPTRVDHAHLQSALLNIVRNARDAMPKGGVLTIETQNIEVDQPEAALLTEIDPGSYVLVTIRDTGHGMTAEVAARATDPFYTTKDAGQGSGLGLSQTHGFILQSNGQMEIQTKVGVGTAVSLYLPKSEQKLAGGTAAARASSILRRGTVLVVEDDPEVLQLATAAIESFGYIVHAASDGRKALEVLKRDIPIDLLFTDVVMPLGLSGVALAREACQLRPTLRVLLASGYPRTIIREREGVEDHMELIAKPYALAALSERLRTLALGAPN